MWKAITAIVALLAALVGYYVESLLKKRRQLAGLPQPPMPNLLLGHLYVAAECRKTFPDDVHPHWWADYIRTKYNLPEVFYVDWRPLGPLFLYVADPVLASRYLTTGQSLPKDPSVKGYIGTFLGENNMVTLEGHRWKTVRAMFNPGFSATNLMSLADYIVDAGLTFCAGLKQKAESGELFELEEASTRLTIDIIGKVALDADLGAQKTVHPITRYFRERVFMMPPPNPGQPWKGFDPLRPLKLWWNGRKLDGAISREVDMKIQRRARELEENEKANGKQAKKRSVLDLALNGYEKDMMLSSSTGAPQHIKTPSDLPPSFRSDIVDQIKTFIFAGHDTTSSTICWALYLLHRHPEDYLRVKAELDTYFGPSSSVAETAAQIKADPHVVNKLEYTTAVIRETLRIFPPASTIRHVDTSIMPGSQNFLVDPTTGQKYPLDLEDCAVWPTAHMIHRNKRFFPQPTRFVPARFIPSLTPFPDCELFAEAGRDAFRPFEKGPRNCIGQELAMLEARIILAMTVRDFDFVLEYPGEEADPQFETPESTVQEFSEKTEYGKAILEGRIRKDRTEGHRVYQTLLGAAKPIGKCPGRVRLREGA